MAFRMIKVSPRTRIGFNKRGDMVLEVWPVDSGWSRDIDPAVSSDDPDEITVPASCLALLLGHLGTETPHEWQRNWAPIHRADTSSEENVFFVTDMNGERFGLAYHDGEDWIVPDSADEYGCPSGLDFAPASFFPLGAVLNKLPAVK